MAPPVNGNRTTRSRSSSPDYDPAAFQASLDESVQQTRALVESWLPSALGHEWDDAFASKKGSDGLQRLKDRARPPRLGLGAQPASLHKQQAEDRKLASRLLRGRTSALGDDGANVALATPQDTDDASSSDDDQDSRARAVGKGKARAASASASANPFVLSTAATRATPNGTPKRTPAPKQLFNDPSPVKPSPSPATASTSTSISAARPAGLMAPIAAASAYAANGGAPLTKNQRKKERERLKRDEERRRREDESRAEAADDEGRGGVTSPRKRVREDGQDGVGIDGGRDEDGDAPEDADVSMASAPPSPTKAAGAEGTDSPGKKKRRKKKKKNGGQGGEALPPLLNLAPLAKAD
ncbi:hypothetical protein JCM3770_006886 [Rhodotorula araucariae]